MNRSATAAHHRINKPQWSHAVILVVIPLNQMPPTTEFRTLAFEDCSGDFDVLPLGSDRYQILDPSICLLREDYSCGDIVSTSCNDENQLVVLERVERGRFKTLDFAMPKGWQENSQTEKLFDKIKFHNGYAVGVFGGILLIALPQDTRYDPSVDIENVLKNMKR